MADFLGEFEQIVLLALLQLGDEAYGVTVQHTIAARTARVPSLGTVYSTLARLEAKGFVVARLGDPTPERGGRRKKHFRLQATGRHALRRSLRALRTMSRGLSAAYDL